MSGSRRSTPRCSSRGKASPASTITIVVAVLVDGHVLADLAEAAERDDPQSHAAECSPCVYAGAWRLEQARAARGSRARARARPRSDRRAAAGGRRRRARAGSSAALIAIGFGATRRISIEGASSRSSARAASCSPAFQSRISSFTCGPTTCVWTQTPPTPPSSRNGRIRSSSPRRGRGRSRRCAAPGRGRRSPA